MAFRVDLTERAVSDLRRLYRRIDAEHGAQAGAWFNGLEDAVLSLNEHPARGATIPEDSNLRQLLYGHRRHRYRIIYAIDDARHVVTVLHIRHGTRDVFRAGEPDDEG